MDETIWHKCRLPLIPRRTADGGWVFGPGQCWRRKVNGRWEYRQDQETYEDFMKRQV